MTPAQRPPAGQLRPDDLAAFRPALLRFARLQLRDDATADDVVQATLLAALKALASFRGEAAPLTWLTGILRRQIVDHYRRMSREAPLPDGSDDDPDAASALDALFTKNGHWQMPPAVWTDPEASLGQDDFLAVFEACLKGVAGKAGRVFALREILELEPQAICKDLGITPSNYWVLMHRARLRLRQCVEHNWFGNDGAR